MGELKNRLQHSHAVGQVGKGNKNAVAQPYVFLSLLFSDSKKFVGNNVLPIVHAINIKI